ncbi:MAG: hypothetical protein QOE96_3289 [Blastocatellia bacterium]|jgi:hypothetical protein|nr:hypothetical protein [Blastocatellia bacterium]
MKEQILPTKPARSFRRRQTFRGTTLMSTNRSAPPNFQVSLVKIKEAARRELGLAPAPPATIVASCFDYGLQKYSPDNWVTIELVRIVQELPGVPEWVKGVAGLFGVGAFLLGTVDIGESLRGQTKPQKLLSFAVPEFQLPKGLALPVPTGQGLFQPEAGTFGFTFAPPLST